MKWRNLYSLLLTNISCLWNIVWKDFRLNVSVKHAIMARSNKRCRGCFRGCHSHPVCVIEDNHLFFSVHCSLMVCGVGLCGLSSAEARNSKLATNNSWAWIEGIFPSFPSGINNKLHTIVVCPNTMKIKEFFLVFVPCCCWGFFQMIGLWTWKGPFQLEYWIHFLLTSSE